MEGRDGEVVGHLKPERERRVEAGERRIPGGGEQGRRTVTARQKRLGQGLAAFMGR